MTAEPGRDTGTGTRAGPGPARTWRVAYLTPGLSLVLMAMMGLELVYLYSGSGLAAWAVRVLVVAAPAIAVSLGLLKAREFYLLTFAAMVTVAALLAEGLERQAFAVALDRAGFLAAFILLMGLLREGAVTSPAVGACGTYLTRQPSRRRFIAIFTGSHLFSVLINLGALSLLAPIIQRGVRQGRDSREPLDEIGTVRERRQLCAALRGFSWFLVWAPTAVTQAVLPVLLPGIDAARLMAIGAVLAAIMLLVSWAEDSLRWLPYRRALIRRGALPKLEAMAFPARAFRDLSLICAVLFGATIAFKLWGAVSIVAGVMLAAPVTLVVWLFAQHCGNGGWTGPRVALGQLKQIGFDSIPAGVRETCSLAAAGYIGTLAARLVPVDLPIMRAIQDLPGWVFLSLLSVTVLAGGQVALSPITTAVFLGSLVAAMPDPPADPTLMALAIAAGTAICTNGAPFASGTLMLARASGHSGVTLAWKWNGSYTILVSVVLFAVFYAMTGGL